MSGLLDDGFQNPGAEYRAKPFWAWNGRLEKDELLRQVHVMKEMGFGGFFMHSRTGLETEYLGEEWFDLINACADEAERLGMEAWLYDEDRWPSGIAGGMVTEEPEYRMMSVKLFVTKPGGYQRNPADVAAFSCRLEGVDAYDCRRIDDGWTESDVRERCEDMDILVFRAIEMTKHSVYNGFTYLDTLSRRATERFIGLTHEKYRAKCGGRLGKSIRGIFTDEPYRGSLMDEFGSGNDFDTWRAPWTPGLPEEFKRAFGYDLVGRLPELFLRLEGRRVSQVKWHYVELVTRLFNENFLAPINEWCEKNGMILTGHMLHEDSLTAQTALNGSVMRSYEHMGWPGVDVLTEGNGNFWIVKQLSSAARQLGKPWTLSELYGCTGWQTDFESYKAMGDWQALFGVNVRCPHLSWYTMLGEAKRDYPASMLHQSAWWREYRHVEDYFARIGYAMSRGKPCCGVLVVNPVESVWCQVRPGWAKWLSAADGGIEWLEERYRLLFQWLAAERIDFDYGDEEMLSRLASVLSDAGGRAALRVGEAEYRAVIVSGMLTIRSSTLKLLEEFAGRGGRVVFAGEAPEYVDALPSAAPAELAAKAVRAAFNRRAVADSVAGCQDVNVCVTGADGRPIDEIFCQARRADDGLYVMLLNVNREKAWRGAHVRIGARGCAEEWRCGTGERWIAAESGEGSLEITADFDAGAERLYRIVPAASADLERRGEPAVTGRHPIPGPYRYELDEPNVCVLDMASWRLDGGEWSGETEILKADRAVRSRLGLPMRGGDMLQPWFAGKMDEKDLGKLELAFRFDIGVLPEGPVELAMESPERFDVTVNGHRIDTAASAGRWVDRCYSRLPVPPSFLRAGWNTVELKTEFRSSVNLEAVYLLGRFGVRADGSRKTLVRLPERLAAGGIAEQGLPFYSGKIRYRLNAGVRPAAGERAFVAVEAFGAACLAVGEDRIIAWRPYEADVTEDLAAGREIGLTAVLTRRNTFGPLHAVPAVLPAYGPDAFVTEGAHYTDDYMLLPAGLLSEPYIKLTR